MRRLLAVLAALAIALAVALVPGGACTRSVYVRFKDRAGNVSAAYRDTIRYAP